MLGVKNPLRNAANPLGDDGLDKSGTVWFNEFGYRVLKMKGDGRPHAVKCTIGRFCRCEYFSFKKYNRFWLD